MEKKKLISLLLLFSLVLAPSGAFAEEDEEFLLGLIPEENIFRQVRKHRPLAEYLSDKLGVRVRFTILSRYPHIIRRFASRELDGAFFGIFTAVLAQEFLGVEPLARPMNLDGGTTAKSYIFTRKDTGIRSVSGMKGRKAAFVDEYTATGFVYSLVYLREQGVKDPGNYFGEHYFTGSHDTTVYAVLAGRAEVGTVKGRVLDKLSLKDPVLKDEITVLSKSMELPDNTLCVRGDLPPEFKEKLRKTLLSMHEDPEGKKVLKEMEAQRFVPAEKKDFVPVRELAAKAGIDLGKFYHK
jgi:phosphonate transport system substrate-binding protein